MSASSSPSPSLRRSQRGDVAAFIVMEVMREAAALEAQGVDVAHLEIGQPGAPAPAAAREAAAQALSDGASMGYTVALGLPALRQRIARLYKERQGLEVDPARIVVTTGSSAGFLLTFLAQFAAGERVAIAEPGYPSYRNILRSLDLEAVGLPVGAADGYQITPAALDAARKAGPLAGLLAASPANPTGVMLSRDEMAGLIDWCAAHGVAYISDEIYDRLFYGPPPVSALSLTDDAVVINSFSKFYCMTGWRIGWMVTPEGLIRQVERLAQNHFICPPHVSQIAALAALDAEAELQGRLETYAANRALLLEAAPAFGLGDLAPADGAFYLYGDISATGLDSTAYCARALREAHVALTPGHDFDPVRGGRFVRLSYAGSRAEVAEGAARLRAWAQRL